MSSVLHWKKLARQEVNLLDRHPYDFYPTNSEHVESALDLVSIKPHWILDAGCGDGVFGYGARQRWQQSSIVGVEIRQDAPFKNWYDWAIRADFLQMPATQNMFDLVIGNPPYSLAESFIRHSLSMLRDGGQLVYLLRLAFLESMGRYALFMHDYPPKQVAVCSDRPSFTGDGKTDATAYAFFLWEKGYQGMTNLTWQLSYPANKDKYGHNQLTMELGA